MLGARPHSQEASTNSRMLPTNSRTMPMRCVAPAGHGTEIALATAKARDDPGALAGSTPRSPAIAGSRDVGGSSCRARSANVASDSAMVPNARSTLQRQDQAPAFHCSAAAGTDPSSNWQRGPGLAAASSAQPCVGATGSSKWARHARGQRHARGGRRDRPRRGPSRSPPVRWVSSPPAPRRPACRAAGDDPAAPERVGPVVRRIEDRGSLSPRKPARRVGSERPAWSHVDGRDHRKPDAGMLMSSSDRGRPVRHALDDLIQLPVAFCAGSSGERRVGACPGPTTRRGDTRPACWVGDQRHRLVDAQLRSCGFPGLASTPAGRAGISDVSGRARLHALAELHRCGGRRPVHRRRQVDAA